jgi:hypothetical protein
VGVSRLDKPEAIYLSCQAAEGESGASRRKKKVIGGDEKVMPSNPAA